VPEHEPVLIDTDVASALYLERYYDRHVSSSLARSLATRRLAISLITLGEAHYGARTRKNDLWIAACATANGLSLATLNRRHFEPLTTFGLALV
jgi:predicted nucleic acid-binding protein